MPRALRRLARRVTFDDALLVFATTCCCCAALLAVAVEIGP